MEPFVALIRRYCIDYTARHDLSVCDDIMVPGYTLHMGVHTWPGGTMPTSPRPRPSSASSPGCA